MKFSDLDLSYDSVNLVYVDQTHILVATKSEDYIIRLRKHFTNDVKHARFMKSVASGNWDGKIRFLQTNGLLPYGLLSECIEKLKEWDIKYVLDEKLVIKQLDISNFDKIIEKELIEKQTKEKLIPWDHQTETAKLLLLAKRGITKSATSSGKSYTITMIAQYLLHMHYVERILLIVPRSDLVIQFERDIAEYGFNMNDVGIFFGKVKDKDKKVLIATWQSLQNVKDREFFEEFDMLIVDECHGSGTGDKTSKGKRSSGGGTKMRQICDLCTNAEWRFGFTGTMPTDPLEYRTVVSGIGPVVSKVGASELMEKGHISKLKIYIPFVQYDKNIVKEKIKENLLEAGITDDMKKEDIPISAKFNAEKKFIENYIPRLQFISKIVKSRLKKDENILVLANTLNFGEKLTKTFNLLLKNYANEIYYIHGDVNEFERKNIRQTMEEKKRIVIVATTSLFSTGISVKNLHTAIFSSMGKSQVRTIQSIGRILRKHSTKEVARVYDIVDDIKYARKHAQERIVFYSEEEYDHEIFEVKI